MKKNHLFVLVIAVIFGLMLALPASAAVSFQKYTPISNAMFKPIPIRIPSVPIKNVSGPVQPLLIPWKQTPLNSQIFKPGMFNRSGFQIRPIPTVIPVANNINGQPRDTWWGTVTVWNKDHTHTVPDTSVKFYALIAPELHCSDDGSSCSFNKGFISKLIGEGKTNSNGILSIDLFTGGERLIKANAVGPVISEDGEQVYYSGGGDLSYESHNLDITIWFRNIVQ